MLQAARTHLIIPEPSEDLITNEPWSIEFYADGLMDELFADIDEILDVSGNLPSQTLRHGSRTPRIIEETSARDWFSLSSQSATAVASEYEHLPTINVPQIVLPNSLTRTSKTVPQVRNKQVSTVVVDKPGVINRPLRTRQSWKKLLIAGTTIGVAIAGTIYLVNSGLLILFTSKLTQPELYLQQTQTQPTTKVDVQVELVNYMLGALAIIEKQGEASNRQFANTRFNNRGISNPSNLAVASNQSIGDLAPPLAANNASPANRSTSVVERIYVPVYQAPSPMRYAPPPNSGAATQTPQVANNQSDAVKTAMNTAQPPAKPADVNMVASAVRPELKPVTVQSAPITVRQQPASLPGLPVAPLRPAVPSQPAPAVTQQQAYVPISAATVANHTLEGLMELGEKSVALFQIEGVTRRVNMGESIGISGWTLVDVSNGEAIVRRNGEVRSIFAGQRL
jgi:hypothetical protein